MFEDLIKEAARKLSKKYGLQPQDLEFLDVWDSGFKGKKFLMFNINKAGHPYHKSTVNEPIR